MENVENQIIDLQLNKEVTALFKFYLEILEELKLPEEKHTLLRKRILNHSNDTIRSLLQFINLFDFTVNAQKVQEATKQRIVFSKTITSQPIIV